MTERAARQIADETVERIQYRIIGDSFRLSVRMKILIRDLIEGEIAEARGHDESTEGSKK